MVGLIKPDRRRTKSCCLASEDVILQELLEENRLLLRRNEELEHSVCLLRIDMDKIKKEHAAQTPPSPSSIGTPTSDAGKRRFDGAGTRELILLRRPSEESTIAVQTAAKAMHTQDLSLLSFIALYVRFYLTVGISVALLLKRGPLRR